MSSNPAITVSNLSKCYQIFDRPRHRLLQMLSRGRKRYGRDFWALKNISFEIERGETIGIVGRNGSGKSTLLQLICKTLYPTSGEVTTHGRVAALLELVSGFNPEFTGRENIYMNASLLGLSKEEINERYSDIVAFADIGPFIDQPVKTYSSGMVVRLAFAVQAQISPDILIVDEALAVGDARFQAKCFARLKQLKDQGASILLVTHSTEQVVSHCSQAILLDGGELIEMGEPRRVVNRYLDLLFGTGVRSEAPQTPSLPTPSIKENQKLAPFNLSTTADLFSSRIGYNPLEYRWGDGRARILDFYLTADGEPLPSSISLGQQVTLGLSIHFSSTVPSPVLGVQIKTKEGVTVYGTNTEMLSLDNFRSMGTSGRVVRAECSFRCDLAPGDYFVSIGVASRDGAEVVPLDRRYDSIHIRVTSSKSFLGLVDLGLNFTTLEAVQ